MADAYPVLYVMVRPLNSMNGGKAQAHSGHAASQFVWMMSQMTEHSSYEAYKAWAGKLGFGTQINLAAGSDERFFKFANAFNIDLDIVSGVVIDPTYPYMVNEEIYDLLPRTRHTSEPFFNEDTGMWHLTREEVTAAWAFGMSDNPDLRNITKRYNLHP